jgi:hypothetical protein
MKTGNAWSNGPDYPLNRLIDLIVTYYLEINCTFYYNYSIFTLKKPLFNIPITSILRQKAEALFHKKTPQKDRHDKESVSLHPKNEIEILRAELEALYKELDYHNKEKNKRADELVIANTELKFQKGEKQDRADELVIVNNQFNHQLNENDKITDALIILNENQTSKKERLSFIIQ